MPPAMLYPHARAAPSYPHASSSSSLSSAASSDLLPPASFSISSQSDIASDIAPSTPPKSLPPRAAHRFFLPLPHRSTSAAHGSPMGQVLAPAATLPPRPASPANTNGGPGGRFRRAWAARRKKSEDITAVFAATGGPPRGDDRGSTDVAPFASVSNLSHTSSPVRGPADERANRPFVAPSKLSVAGGRKTSEVSVPTPSGSPPPPPPPPKEAPIPQPLSTPQPSLQRPLPDGEDVILVPRVKDSLPSVPPQSPLLLPSASPPALDKEREKLKEDWRKSDSTMTSHHTIRPGALGGNRSPRPVSLAESSHSGNTIVPPVNKRLSALLTDAEFMTVEEGESDSSDAEGSARGGVAGERLMRWGSRERPRNSPSHSPAGSVRARNRRSMSLNLVPGVSLRSSGVAEPTLQPQARSPSNPAQFPSQSSTNMAPSMPTSNFRDTPTLTRTAANGFIAPLNTSGAQHTTGSNIRSRLAAWTSVSAGSTPTQTRPDRQIPAAPPGAQRGLGWRRVHQLGQQPNQAQGNLAPPPVRQPAVSMTSSLAPAAGFAMGLGKRAVEKVVGKAWGGFSTSSSNASVSGTSIHSSASSVTSSDHGHGLGLGRTVSRDANNVLSQGGGGPPAGAAKAKGKKMKRRFGPAPSIASSITSSSLSDVDGFSASGPVLGRRVRGPRRTPSGASIIGGLVFKQDLRKCVEETAIDGVWARVTGAQDERRVRPLEERLLPALVVRCAQHVLWWGMQEEGLFRVSGRSSHVARLRAEFDAGSDWDMTTCDPSNLDPHAVASIFKTYLRELPENILTSSLIPFFESAFAKEEQASRASTDSSTDGSVNSSVLSHHRSGSVLALRKAPSLSTLAVPSFAGKRTVSDALLNALTWLIDRLPAENRDLLYTVVELIKATAQHSAQTKMPLGNLLLVFCPSLNMNPALLRVLCEHDTIWEGVPQPIITVDADADAGGDSDESEDEPADVRATFVTAPELRFSVEEASGLLSQVPSTSTTDITTDDEVQLPTPEDPSSAVIAMKAENRSAHVIPVEISDASGTLAPESPSLDRWRTIQRTPELVLLPPISPVSPVSLRDDSASFVSALEPPSVGSTRAPSPLGDSGRCSPRTVPPLSSSAESLSSPSEMSEEPLSPHKGLSSGTPASVGNEKQRHISSQNESQDSLAIPVPANDEEAMSSHRPTAGSPAPSLAPTESSTSAPVVAVPFPSLGGSTPSTPVSPRKSFSLLGFSSLRSDPGITSSSPTSPLASDGPPPSSWHRPKRPSLQLLLQKITGGTASHPATPNISAPIAMASVPTLSFYSVEQAQSATASVPVLSEASLNKSASSAPPKLDTAISSSPIKFGFQHEESGHGKGGAPETRVTPIVVQVSPASSASGSGSDSMPGGGLEYQGHARSRTESFVPSIYTTPIWRTPQTPIADLYQNQGRSKSALSFFNDDLDPEHRGRERDRSTVLDAREDGASLLMTRSRSEASQVSITPSIELPVEETQDWAESVFLAAQGTNPDGPATVADTLL